MVSLLMDLQQRIPDKWFFRRLLPAVVFVIVAVACGGQLGQAHWADLSLARDRVAPALRVTGTTAPDALASLVLVAVAVVLCALAVPVAAVGVGALANGAWPWWLAPLGERMLRARERRRDRHLAITEDEVKAAVRKGLILKAARLDARKNAAVLASQPTSYTWCGDRFNATRARIGRETGTDIVAAWTALRLTLDDSSRAALAACRDSFNAACEAVVWSAAAVVLGAWWWPTLPAGLVLGTIAWRWLRRSVTEFCETTEVIALQHIGDLPASLRPNPSRPPTATASGTAESPGSPAVTGTEPNEAHNLPPRPAA